MNALTQFFTRRRKSMYVAVGLVMAALIGVGGALTGAALSSTSSGSSATAATLNAAMSSTTGPAATTPAAKAHRAAALVRLRRLGGLYGQASFRGKDGSTRTLAYERGTVTSAGRDLVVKAANGTTMTWNYASDTTVREAGKKASRSDLASGQHVLVAGPVSSGRHDARVVIVAKPKAARSGSTPSAAPSSSAGTSSS
ncbi:MAG TPA: hypothetical protein VGI21_22865 [Streptosporangiaceae bacterium]|jgi:hypothetical protein